MKSLSAATVIALSLAFAGQASATQPPEPLSEAQLDQLVAGTSNHGNSFGKGHGNRGKSHGYGQDKDYGKNRGDKYGKGQDVAGIVGTGIIALRK